MKIRQALPTLAALLFFALFTLDNTGTFSLLIQHPWSMGNADGGLVTYALQNLFRLQEFLDGISLKINLSGRMLATEILAAMISMAAVEDALCVVAVLRSSSSLPLPYLIHVSIFCFLRTVHQRLFADVMFEFVIEEG